MGLYERIKEIAKSKGYSINRLEKELGFARSSISKFNKNVPGIDKLKQIAEFLDIPVSDLIDENPNLATDMHKTLNVISKRISHANSDSIFIDIVKSVLEEQLKKEQLEELNRRIKEQLPADFGMPKSTIAAHFTGDEYTEDELDEIKQFAEFVKNKRKS